ncbi:autotransporter assembly complex protein TamA [Roseovarius sp. D22-M7]|uniref:autotransporter assembly complex protein TamA n=1 Tax=Roseovarius sp. D22-M7 TaxID=3127116 RepID=UPI00300FCA40
MKTAYLTRAACVAAFLGWATLPAAAVTVGFAAPGASDRFEQTLQDASLVISTAREGDGTAQDLLAAARADYARMVGVLYAEGYFGGVVNIRVNGREAAEIPPLDAPDEIERIDIIVTRGTPFRFERASVAPLPRGAELPEDFALRKRAKGDLITRATRTGIDAWRDVGHAKAGVAGQTIIADHARNRLSAEVTLDPGPRLRFGKLVIEQGETPSSVRKGRIRAIAGLPRGETFSPEEVEDAANRLRRTGAFSSVTISEAETPNPDGTLDMQTRVTDAKPRRIGVGAELSSPEGITLSGFWLHRNLLGGAERLRLDAMIGGIAGDSGGEDFRLGARIDRPATFSPETGAFLLADIEQNDEPDYRERKAEIGGGLTHRFSDELTAEAGLRYRYSDIDDDLGNRELQHLLLPLRATWDRRDEPLNPKSGLYLDVTVTPFLRLDESGAGSRVYADLRDYVTFGESERLTLAGRAQVGSVAGAAREDVPADFLFYSGGAGTVRGQDYQSLGVDLASGGTVGGRSFIGFSGEVRGMITDTLQAVAFADTGFVGQDAFGTGSGEWHSGAGLGARYFTPVGPIRFDVAVPVDGEDAGGQLEIYIGIGQAF